MPTISNNKVDFGLPKNQRGSFTKDPELLKFYNSAAWRKFSYYIRNVRDKYCVICKKEGIVRRSEHCDHIKPISEGGARLDGASPSRQKPGIGAC